MNEHEKEIQFGYKFFKRLVKETSKDVVIPDLPTHDFELIMKTTIVQTVLPSNIATNEPSHYDASIDDDVSVSECKLITEFIFVKKYQYEHKLVEYFSLFDYSKTNDTGKNILIDYVLLVLREKNISHSYFIF